MTTAATPPLPTTLPARRRWTVAEFERAWKQGVFGPDERLELIEGEIYKKVSPQKSLHATGVGLSDEAVSRIFTEGYSIRVQLPLSLGAKSQPEPDIAVVLGSIRDYRDAHPTSAVLIIEVSDSTLAMDRGLKASLYARSGIADYWILNLVDRVLEVHRDPAPMADQPFGYHYRSITRLTEKDSIAPLALPNAAVVAADLLP